MVFGLLLGIWGNYMEHLFWKGDDLDKNNRILILGESHYGDDPTCVGQYTPEDYSIEVMKLFIEADERSSWHLFFERVADSFGYSEKEPVVDFFDKICYGNYVTRFCDENNSKVAEEDIAANKVEYNNRLFEFVNANSIDAIVCFSKLAYWSLPKGNEKDESFEEMIISPPGVRKRIIEKYCYAPGVGHGCCDVILNKPLMVYGVNHPTGSHGYSHYEVFEVVKNEEILKNIIFVNEVGY